MNILYISSMFPIEGGTIYTDLAEAVNAKGHNITVAATMDWGAKNSGMLRERDMDILRIKTLPMYNVGFIKKGIAFITLSYYFKKAIKKHLKNMRYDLILFESPPVTIWSVIRYAMRLFKCPSYLMMKDIFPMNAVDLKIMIKNSPPYLYFKYCEKKLYNTATMIGCMSQANVEYIHKHSRINNNKLTVFPNAKKISALSNKTDRQELEKLNIPSDAVVCLYGGNMGKPQYVELLAAAARALKDENIYFLFIGRGNEKAKLNGLIADLPKAISLDSLPRESYERITAQCDIGLIVLSPMFTIPNFPSRAISYMEYAIPVITATDRATDIGDMIENAECGIKGYSDDLESFLDNILTLAKDREKREKMGLNGRRFMEKHYDVDITVELLEQYVKEYNH